MEYRDLEAAIQIAKSIENKDERSKALVYIAESQSRVDKAAAKLTFDIALQSSESITDNDIRVYSIANIAES